MTNCGINRFRGRLLRSRWRWRWYWSIDKLCWWLNLLLLERRDDRLLLEQWFMVVIVQQTRSDVIRWSEIFEQVELC